MNRELGFLSVARVFAKRSVGKTYVHACFAGCASLQKQPAFIRSDIDNL